MSCAVSLSCSALPSGGWQLPRELGFTFGQLSLTWWVPAEPGMKLTLHLEKWR